MLAHLKTWGCGRRRSSESLISNLQLPPQQGFSSISCWKIVSLTNQQPPRFLLILIIAHFYRTQVSLGSGLWVPVSVCTSLQELCETLLMWLWLMMIPTQYWLMKPIGQFGIDGGQWSLRWWWSSKLVWRCLMWAMRSLRGSVRWCKSCRECWTLVQCDYVGDNIGWWAIG